MWVVFIVLISATGHKPLVGIYNSTANVGRPPRDRLVSLMPTMSSAATSFSFDHQDPISYHLLLFIEWHEEGQKTWWKS